MLLIACGPAFRSTCSGAEKTARLRLAWGSGTAAKQRWTGTISIEGAQLTRLQPLGIEADAPVAFRIDGSRLIVNPLVKRGFDGCDVTVRADESSTIRVELRNSQSPQATVFESSLEDVLANQVQRPLDELGSYFLARRSPGDVLRVLPTRDHLVFEPGEIWKLKLQPDLAAEVANGPVVVDVRMRATGEEKPTWQASQQISEASQVELGIGFDVPCPAKEGAYRLTVAARPQEGLATRFVPGQQAKPIASREIDFVVIDPAAKLPQLVDHWLPVLTIDPANPSWWQRLPAWAQVPRLRERTPGAVGNVRPVVRPTAQGEFLELPPAPSSGDPYWQSYTLPVRDPGEPHLVEIEYPLGDEQSLAISLVEPDAAGKVTTTQQDASIFCAGHTSGEHGEIGVHRFLIWPRTRLPQLLIMNSHAEKPGRYGIIRLLSQDTAVASLTEVPVTNREERLLAGYLHRPLLADSCGAAEVLDSESGLSVQGWSTFLDSTRRLAQTLRLAGYNGLMISVAADGSALYPSRLINPSPRYDTGLLAASGRDPMHKDVLEMLLRVFDREGLRVIPTLQLAAPLPSLEPLRQAGASQVVGISCINYRGQTWQATNSGDSSLAPFYNPLDDRVQSELAELVRELTSRYAQHESLSGVGVQISGDGYGLMPGLAWGFDHQTVSQFSKTANVPMPLEGADAYRQRAHLLLGEHRALWKQWRQAKLAELYVKLAEEVTTARADLKLTVAMEDLFSSTELRQRVRRTISEQESFADILADHAIDLAQIESHPAINVLVPHRTLADSVSHDAIEARLNTAAEQGELLGSEQRRADMFFHEAIATRLPSFDQLSPFGSERTYLTVHQQRRIAGENQLRQLATSLASGESLAIVEGGSQIELIGDSRVREARLTFRQLPTAAVETRTQRSQPMVMRIYRNQGETIMKLINESPWPVQAEIQLDASRPSEWRKLGSGQVDSVDQLTGTLNGDGQVWKVELKPYDLQAWKFSDERLRVGELKLNVSEVAKQDLQDRISEMQSRVSNLGIERPYQQLQNPSFELQDGEVRIVGWQPRQGTIGAVGLDTANPRSGNLALRLQSSDSTGVAVQSHLFPNPDTGQLMVSFFLRVNHTAEDAQLRVAVQDQNEGRDYQQFAVLDSRQLSESGWLRHELPLNDVPVGPEQKLRLHFHLTGNADLLLDDIELFDLRFDESRRRALVKRIHGANIALQQNQVVDCMHVVDDYWSRFLVEHVPPTRSEIALATKQTVTGVPTPEEPSSDEEKGIRSRLRGWVPKVWR